MSRGCILSTIFLLTSCSLLLTSCGDDKTEQPSTTAAPSIAPVKKAPEPSPPPKKRLRKEHPSLLEFRPGPYAVPSGQANTAEVTPRQLETGLTEEDAEIADMLRSNLITLEKARCLDVIARLNAMSSEGVLEVVSQLLKHQDAEVRASALSTLEGVGHPGMGAILATALRDRDADIRLLAIDLLHSTPTDANVSLLTRSLEDQDTNVRSAAFYAGMQQEETKRRQIIAQAATSLQADLAIAALSVLESESRKTNVPYLIRALGHPSDAVRETARESLALTFHAPFTDTASATRWWAANQHRYSAELVEEQPPR
jgi:hypothetical protein